MDASPEFLAVIAAVVLVAGAVKGVMGLGLPTISVGLLGLVMPPMQAAALIVLPTFLTNFWQTVAGPSLIGTLRRFWPLQLGILAGTFVGGELMTRANPVIAKGWLGVALALYALLGLLRLSFRVARGQERWLGVPMGLATGIANGATGLFVVPGALYMQSLDLSKDELVQAFGLTALVASFGLGLVLMRADVLGAGLAGTSLMTLIPAFAGMAIGQQVRAHIPQDLFRRCFFVAMLALGAYLASRLVV